ncbi:MAG: hypothetical protein HQ567_18715 [Candidatus Nealsonbacteria bacterium]|nr:hypothetical protein [Candidatus Nealsonbacteria bacterium]
MKRVLLRALLLIAVSSTAVGAAPPDLAFRPADKGYFQFDTGTVRGKVRLDGRSQGIASLVDVASGTDIAHGGGLPGVFSLYRIFSTDTRYGHAARDWPTVSKVLPDGALEVRWPPAEDHPLELSAVYRWTAPDVLDLETTVKPQRDMPRFEVFLSSYFVKDMRALVYVKPNRFSSGKPQMLPADVNPLVDGTYLMFPRDRAAALMIFDRRWEHPPNPVQWSVTRHLAAPLSIRRNEQTGLAAAIMAPPEDCFAVSTPYNKTPPDGVAGHNSTYLSLFGQDLKTGQTARARCRLVVGKITDERAIELYEAYRKQIEASSDETDPKSQ